MSETLQNEDAPAGTWDRGSECRVGLDRRRRSLFCVFESAPVAVGSCVQKPPWECSGVNQEGGGRGGDGPEQAGSHPSKEGLTPVPARVFSLEGHWIFQKAEGLTCRVSSRVARVSLRLWTETRHRVHRSLQLS